MNQAELSPQAEDLRPELWADPWWRICNLYRIVDETGKVIPFVPNDEQRALYENLHTRNLILKARQLGFTTFLCILALDQCVWNADYQAGIIAHNREDAEKFFRNKVMFAYDRLPQAVRDGAAVVKRTESMVTFANGSSLYVGTSFRGGTLQFLHISEFGKICRKFPDKAKEIVTGALEAVAAGNLAFIESTAEGQGGYFYEYAMEALKAQQEGRALTTLDWRLHFFPWYAKGAYQLPPQGVTVSDKQARYFRELEAKLGTKFTPEQRAWWVRKKAALMQDMGREYPSTPQEAFEQAVEGAIYGEQMTWLREQGRIGRVSFEAGIEVNTFWDFGVGDANTIWLHQRVANEHHWIRYFSDSGHGLRHYWRLLKEWADDHGAIWGRHFLPHDADARIQGEDVTTRRLILEGLGMRDIVVVPRIADIALGIDKTRTALVGAHWFDAEACAEGIKCLDSYQYEWDDRLARWTNNPLHNWASHGADAWRQFAQGYTDRNAERLTRRSARDWKTS